MIQEILFILNRSRDNLAPRRIFRAWRKNITEWVYFWKSYQKYKKFTQIKNQNLLDNLYPCLGDNTTETLIEPIYFYQDCWAFEKIVNCHPQHHVDVGSNHKFVALLSKTVPVTMVDIRPLSLPLKSLQFKKGSILELPFEDSSIDSLSSLCVVEHIGLGRYGDSLDPEGTEKAIAELKRVISLGGDLYLSIPIDDENKTYFNAHRAFSQEYLYKLFEPFKVIESKYIYGSKFSQELEKGFGTGCFHLKRLK